MWQNVSLCWNTKIRVLYRAPSIHKSVPFSFVGPVSLVPWLSVKEFAEFLLDLPEIQYPISHSILLCLECQCRIRGSFVSKNLWCGFFRRSLVWKFSQAYNTQTLRLEVTCAGGDESSNGMHRSKFRLTLSARYSLIKRSSANVNDGAWRKKLRALQKMYLE